MNTVTTLLSFDEMYTDKKFYRLIFPYKNSEYPIKQNLELINHLYKKYLKAKERTNSPKRSDIFDYWHFMEKGFYLERGYTLEEAEKLIQIKVNKRKETFRKKSPEELEEIAFKKNVFDPKNLKRIHPELSEEEIHSLVERHKKRSADILQTLSKCPMSFITRSKNHFCKEYYMAKGYNEAQAKEILSKNAASRKISVIMERYGLTEAEAKIKQREIINKGLKKYYGRPKEERVEIAIKRTQFNKQYSKRALQVLNRLILYLKDLSDDFKNFHYLMGKNEIYLKDLKTSKIRYYDLCIQECKILIEYNGYLYHPRITDTKLPDGRVITVKDSIQNDELKYKMATENGYQLFYLYEIPNKILKEYKQAKQLSKIIYENYIAKRSSR